MIEAIIFDFYGVIYSNLNWDVVDQRIKTDSKKAEEFRRIVSSANIGEITNLELLAQVSELAEDSKYPEQLAVNVEPSINYSALGLIDNLRGKYKVGLLSNGSRQAIDEALASVGGVQAYFDVVQSSSDTKFIKPAKNAFLFMVKQLGGTLSTTLVIDDSHRHIKGAKEAGLTTIKFSDMEQLRVDLKDLGVI